jgi:hypothetical protein
VDRTTIIHGWCLSKAAPSEADFYAAFVDQSGQYILEEGPTWDFKQEWPFSYSNPYFGGIARLICAFANT